MAGARAYHGWVVRDALRLFLIVIAGACGGCGEAGLLERAELQIGASGWYGLSVLLLARSAGCSQQVGVTYSLDGVPMTGDAPCVAGRRGLTEDRSFTIDVRHGSDRAQVVVADMFPGLHATVLDPPDGRVAPGGDIVFSIPAAVAQFGWPYNALFSYTDADDPAYTGTTADVDGASGAETAHVQAPTHPGHFALHIQMMANDTAVFPAGTIVSCTGLATCTARAAIDVGPLAIEVVAGAM
jgi:hypothetical protein